MKIKRLFDHIFSGLPSTPVLSTNLAGPSFWLADSGQGGGKTIEAQRRRRSDPAPGGRERAEAPQRKRPTASGSGGSGYSSGGSGGGMPRRPFPGGGQMPGGLKLSPLAMIVLVVFFVVCVLPVMIFLGPGDSGETGQNQPEPISQERATATPRPAATARPVRPTSLSTTGTAGQKWLVMLYQDADDKILEEDIYVDLNEAERVGSTDQVQIVAQLDRFKGGYSGDGNWTSAKRFYITPDDDLEQLHSQPVADLGEVNMSDPQTLVDFVTWAAATYPADKYVLILSDHGMGWPGGWSDPAPGGQGDPRIPMTAALGNDLYLMQLDEALGKIRTQAGIDRFELIGLDACLMAHLEVFSALAPHARYAVASQETEPALGWAYTSFLESLARDPNQDGAALGQLIVDSYIQDDQRIVDPQARADFLGQSFGRGGVSASRLAQEMGQGITLTALDLAEMPALMDSVNQLSFGLQAENQKAVAQARTYAQSFTSIFGNEVPPSYIDLGSFARLLQTKGTNPEVGQAAERVLAALNQAIIAEKHGPQKAGASGVSIYFPNSQLYQSPVAGPESYLAIARRFAEESLWDDFLTFHYTGQPFKAAAGPVAAPPRNAPVTAPGGGGITVSPITLSGSVAAPGQPVTLSAQIEGKNVGYAYFFTGFLDQPSNSIFVADTDYLESGDTREIDGVFYPDWGEEGKFTLKFSWEPLMYAITDGETSVTAMLKPQSFGATYEEAVYTVDGTYTYADGGESRSARLYFSNGELKQVFGFTDEGATGAPREIIPHPGDTFTVQETWLDLDRQGQVAKTATQPGGTLTFGAAPFRWKELDAAVGEYIVGFIIEDLDGNRYESYEPVTVQ